MPDMKKVLFSVLYQSIWKGGGWKRETKEEGGKEPRGVGETEGGREGGTEGGKSVTHFLLTVTPTDQM